MANIIEKILFKPRQCALLDTTISGKVRTRQGYLLNKLGSFSTTEFSIETDLGHISATFVHPNPYALNPVEYYTASVITSGGQSISVYQGLFAKVMYKKLKRRHEQDKQHVR